MFPANFVVSGTSEVRRADLSQRGSRPLDQLAAVRDPIVILDSGLDRITCIRLPEGVEQVMSRFDENIFSRIALFNNYISKAQLEECVRIKREESCEKSLGDLLLEKGYISREQLASVLNIRRKKIRKYLRNPKELRESDKAFGRIVLTQGLIALDDLEAALIEQEHLARLNLRFQIGEILVAKNRLSAESVRNVLSQQGKRVLLCPVCDCHYNVVEFQATKAYRCIKCDSELEEPNYLDAVAVDAVL